MAGRPKLKMYQYSSEFKYMRSYDSQSEIFDKYYDSKKGDLFINKQYRELPDGTFVSWYKIGRKGLKYHTRVDNCPYCDKNVCDRPFSAYNYLGEKVASFANIRVFRTLVPNISDSTVISSLRNTKGFSTKKLNLYFKYD